METFQHSSHHLWPPILLHHRTTRPRLLMRLQRLPNERNCHKLHPVFLKAVTRTKPSSSCVRMPLTVLLIPHQRPLDRSYISCTSTWGVKPKRYIQNIDSLQRSVKVPVAYSRQKVPASQEDIATPEIAQSWKHLEGIAHLIHRHTDIEIGLLIGRNFPSAFQPLRIIYDRDKAFG